MESVSRVLWLNGISGMNSQRTLTFQDRVETLGALTPGDGQQLRRRLDRVVGYAVAECFSARSCSTVSSVARSMR